MSIESLGFSQNHLPNSAPSTETSKSERTKHLKSNEVDDIKDYIFQNKDKITDPDNALRFISAIGKLIASPKFERKTLQQDIYDLTGIASHCENYPTVEHFNQTVSTIHSMVLEIFKRTKNDKEKLQFINHGLSNDCCFEARVEDLMNFDKRINSLFGKLQFEIKDLKIKLENKIIKTSQLITYLDETDFFKKNGLNKENFKESPEIKKLESLGLIDTEIQSINKRINDAICIYEEFNSGMDNFKKYLQNTLTLTESENSKLDQLIEEYFQSFPENRKWI